MLGKILLLGTLLVLQLDNSGAELSDAKLFSSGIVSQEAPATAAIFGTFTEAPVIVTLDLRVKLLKNLHETVTSTI